MSYISTMMECFAVVMRPSPTVESGSGARRGIVLDPFVPVDPIKGGPAAFRQPTPLPCSVQQASPRDIILYGQGNAEFGTIIIFAQNPRCQKNDRIQVTDRTGDVMNYAVVGAARPVGRAEQWVVTANFIEQPLYP